MMPARRTALAAEPTATPATASIIQNHAENLLRAGVNNPLFTLPTIISGSPKLNIILSYKKPFSAR